MSRDDVHLYNDLLLHEVEAHGEDGHPEEDVDRSDDELCLRFGLVNIVRYLGSISLTF
jgi:hypothetical protein